MSHTAAILLTAHPTSSAPDDAFLTKIDGRESALRAIELFTNRDPITQVILVVGPSVAEEVKRRLGSHLMFMGVKLVTAAGGWYAQLAAAAGRLDDGITRVVVHDAARPATPFTDLESLMDTAEPAAALALPVGGVIARAEAVPGPGVIEPMKVASVITPRLYDRPVFEAVCRNAHEPARLSLFESSPLNVRCGEVPASVVKAMVQLLPKPKVNAPTNPFEEAQW